MRTSYILPAVSLLAAAWTQAAPLISELSFKDNFDSAAPSDLNTDATPRQTGLVAPLSYSISANPPQLGEGAAPNAVLLPSNSLFSPNHNFVEGRRFTIEFDVNPGVDDDAGDGLSADWCAVVFGASSQNVFVNGSDGVGILFRNNGDIQTFDGGTALYGGPGITGGCPRDRAFHVRLEVSAGNFSGAPASLQMFVNDTLAQIGPGNATTLTKAAGFRNNYVTLEGYGFPGPWTHVFDNLTVSAVPDIQVSPTSRTIDKQINPISDPITVTVPAQLIATGAAQVTVTSSAPGVVVPTGGTPGGVLTLDFAKGGPTSKTFTLTGVSAGAATLTVAGPADVNVSGGVTVFVTDGVAYDEILLTDSFNVAEASLDVNSELATRQGGVLKTLNYTEGAASIAGGPADETTQLGPPIFPVRLIIINQGGGVSPDHNFLEGTEFTVEAEVHPGANATERSSADWAAIVVGNSTPNSFVISQDGFGVLFRINGAIEVWNGGARVYGSAPGLLTELPYKVKLTSKSANFAGAPATLNLTVNGNTVPLTDTSNEFVKTSGFRNNYITLEGIGADWEHHFDNLKISAKAGVGFTSRSVESAVGRSETAVIRVPSGLVASGPAVVKVISTDTSVAKLTGAAANGELTLNFAQGGPLTLPVPIQVVGAGFAQLRIVSSAGAAAGEPFGVSVRTALVKNPSFEENYNPTFPGYSDIAQWEKSGGGGVNQSGGPFHDNSTIPDRDRVAFLQGSGTLSQTLSGLIAGKTYWVQFRYNVRGCCGGTIGLATRIDDVEVDNIADIKTAAPNPYYFRNVPFKAASETVRLTFATTAAGDATAVLDGVTVIQRDEGNVVVANPSFEASGDPASPGVIGPRLLMGWTGTGTYGVNFSGAGPFADNGRAPDQDHAAFLQGASSLGQTVPRLTAASNYRLQWNYNARTGNTARLRVKVGATIVWEEDVSAVGLGQPYRTASVDFVSGGVSADLLFEQVAAGDQTVLLDDIRLLGQSVTLPCLGVSPGQLELSGNQTASVAITVPAQLIAAAPATIKLRSSNPEIVRLEGAAPDGILSVVFLAGGETRQDITLRTLAVGRASVEVVSAGGLCVDNGVSVVVSGSFVRNPSFEANLAGGFPGYGSILAWTGGSGLNNSAGPFHDNGVIPDRSQIGFIQGGGTLSQVLANLVPGKRYWLQFRYNTRNCCGGTIGFTVRFNDTDLLTVDAVSPVGGTADYFAAHTEFVPTVDSGTLSFNATASGDATLLLDAVNIVQRDAGQIVLSNPSFEAEGNVAFPGYIQPARISGWVGSGNYGVNAFAVGPFADNGVGPDQDTVAFVQGQGSSLSQSVSGLTSGETYTVKYSVNSRGGNTPQYRVSFDGATLLEEPIAPVGGANPYALRSVVFTAPATGGVLKFEQIAAGDNTIVLDNVQIIPGGTVTEPAPSLGVTRTPEGNLRLAWPSSFTGWRLFAAGVVNGPYSLVNSPVIVDGVTQFVVVPATLAQQFYRLQK